MFARNVILFSIAVSGLERIVKNGAKKHYHFRSARIYGILRIGIISPRTFNHNNNYLEFQVAWNLRKFNCGMWLAKTLS